MVGGNQAAMQMRVWNGDTATFESAVAAPVDEAIEAAIDMQTAAALYTAWSWLISQHDLIGRGRALYLWDKVCARRMDLQANVKEWRYAERVLFGTLTSIWNGLSRLASEPLAKDGTNGHVERNWLDAVIAALEEAKDIENHLAIESLHTLLDLVARVFAMNGDGAFSRLTLWRGVVWNEAMALTRYAYCQEERLLAFPNAIDDASVPDDAARFILCLYADSMVPMSHQEYPVETLAARVVSGQGAQWRESRIEKMEPVTAGEIERLLRHLVFTNPLMAELLQKRINYRLRSYHRSPVQIESVKSLGQEVLLLGPLQVGKSSFLFASETLCLPDESSSPNPPTGSYPGICLQHVSGNDAILQEMRRGWQGGQESHTDDFIMTAQTKPIGLCSFHFVDPPGEHARAVHAKPGGMFHGVLEANVERLRPSVVVVLLPPDGPDDNSELEYALERTLHGISRQRRTTSLPIYIVVNKSDELLKALRDDGADEGLLTDLRKELHDKAFELGHYLDDSGGEQGAADADTVLRKLLNDPDLTTNVAVRELVVRVLEKYKSLVVLLRLKGFVNVTLVFTCSLPMNDNPENRLLNVGVNAFWKHLWVSSCPLFSEALRRWSKETFVENLRSNSVKVANMYRGSRNLCLGRMEGFSDKRLRQGLEKLSADMLKAAGSILGEFDTTNNNEFESEIRRLSRNAGCDYVMEHADDFAKNIHNLSSVWDNLLYRLIAELNIWPDQECNKFIPDKLDQQQVDWLRQIAPSTSNDTAETDNSSTRSAAEAEKTLRKDHIHGYYGALRHSSICRNQYGNPRLSPEWLKKGNIASVARYVRNGVKSAKTSHELIPEPLLETLWLISDYGFEDEKNRVESDPDYTCLTVRRWDTDWFRLRSLLKIHPENRIRTVISLLKRLVKIHDLIKSGPQIRGVLMGFVIAHVLNASGFNVESIEEDKEGFISVINSLHEELLPIYSQMSTLPFKLKSLTGKKGETMVKIEKLNSEGKLNKYARQGFIAVGTRTVDVKNMLKLLSFARLAVHTCTTVNYQLQINPDHVVSEILNTQQVFMNDCETYDEKVREYVDTTLKLLMQAHCEYLDAADLLSAGQRNVLSNIIERPFLAKAHVGDAQIERDWHAWINDVVDQFSEAIDALDRTETAG